MNFDDSSRYCCFLIVWGLGIGDSFHIKKYYIDDFRGQCVVGYWLTEQVYKTYPYGDSIEAQISEGKIIREVEASAEGLKQISDYLYMELKGSEIDSVDYGYYYTVYDPLW